MGTNAETPAVASSSLMNGNMPAGGAELTGFRTGSEAPSADVPDMTNSVAPAVGLPVVNNGSAPYATLNATGPVTTKTLTLQLTGETIAPQADNVTLTSGTRYVSAVSPSIETQAKTAGALGRPGRRLGRRLGVVVGVGIVLTLI